MSTAELVLGDGDSHEAVDAANTHLWAAKNGIDLDTLAYGTGDDLTRVDGVRPDTSETRNFNRGDLAFWTGHLTGQSPFFKDLAPNWLG